MDLAVYSQYYRTDTLERQLKIDQNLRRNLNHPFISGMMLFCQSNPPPVLQGTVTVEMVATDERITYAEWFRWLKRQDPGVCLLLNADNYLNTGMVCLKSSFNTPEAFVALTRTNSGHAGFHLNDDPHWTQDVLGLRAEAEPLESRLDARTAHDSNKTSDWPYGGASTVHPSLAPDDDAELEFTPWTRLGQQPAGVLINQQAIEQGAHQLCHSEAKVAQRFLDLQLFTGLSWAHEAENSARLGGDLHPFATFATKMTPLPRNPRKGQHTPKNCRKNQQSPREVSVMYSAYTGKTSRQLPKNLSSNRVNQESRLIHFYSINKDKHEPVEPGGAGQC